MKKSVWILILVLIGFIYPAKANVLLPQVRSLPEALFSADGKYTLIQTQDSIENQALPVWTLYLNVSNNVLSEIIPIGDTMYFISKEVKGNHYPSLKTEFGTLQAYRVVNSMSKSEFLNQYQLNIQPLAYEQNLETKIDTAVVKVVQAPFADTIQQHQYQVNYLLNASLLMTDSAQSNLDSSVFVVKDEAEKEKNTRLYFDPQSQFYWIQSSIYSEQITFTQKKINKDTVIFSDLQKQLKQSRKFGRLFISTQI